MINLGGLAAKAAGLNWYKYGAYAAVIVAWTVAVHMRATNSVEMKYATQRAVDAEAKIEYIVTEIKNRMPTVQLREVESAKDKAEIAHLRGVLYEAILRRTPNVACDLSDAELAAFNSMSAKTRKPTAE